MKESATWSSSEVQTLWRYIVSSIDRLVALAGDLDDEGLHWRPNANGANSVAVLVSHTLSNAEENLLGVLAGRDVERDRDSDFEEKGTPAVVLAGDWRELRRRIELSLRLVNGSALGATLDHPRRGSITGREVLIVVARHTAEHLGQAELTRDLWHASAPGSHGRVVP